MSFRSVVGSKLPSVPATTGDVPVANAVNVVLPAGANSSTYFRKLASFAVPPPLVRVVSVALGAGLGRAAVGGVPSGTVAVTVRVAVPETVPSVALIFVDPVATP